MSIQYVRITLAIKPKQEGLKVLYCSPGHRDLKSSPYRCLKVDMKICHLHAYTVCKQTLEKTILLITCPCGHKLAM